jgi:hypothetical protein
MRRSLLFRLASDLRKLPDHQGWTRIPSTEDDTPVASTRAGAAALVPGASRGIGTAQSDRAVSARSPDVRRQLGAHGLGQENLADSTPMQIGVVYPQIELRTRDKIT